MNLLKILAVGCFALVVSGCAIKSAIPTERQRFYWPQLPDRPRIEWLNGYSSQLDIPKTFLSRLKMAAVGEDEPVSLRKPLDIRADDDGRVYVADPGASSVYVFDFPAKELRFLALDDEKKSAKELVGLAVDAERRVYVLDARQGKINVFDAAGKLVREFVIDEQVRRGAGLAFDRRLNRLFVTDTGAHKVCAYSPKGDFLFCFGGPGGGEGEFNFPVGVAVDSRGRVVVADAMNARVQIFSSEGRYLSKFGKRGDGAGDFQQIKAVAVDSDDNIYVTDGRSHRFLIFNSAGDFLLPIGGFFSSAGSRHGPGGFALPQGIDVDQNDTIYVVDQVNHRFQVFRYLSEKKPWNRSLPSLLLGESALP